MSSTNIDQQPVPQQSNSWPKSLLSSGEMGKYVYNMNWSKTPLGPIESWPQSLRTTIGLCLASNYPISLAWGKEFTQIYNDGYWPICGDKHPYSMGQDFRECWASAWPVIGDAFELAVKGETSYLENQRLFLDRNGYLEETFFTFSFSPIRDESGNIGGLFHPVTEQTDKMLSERRTRALRDLAVRTGKAKTIQDAFTVSVQTLSEFELDLPFVLFYQVEGKTVTLMTSTGLEPGSEVSPESVDIETCSSWPFAEVIRSVQPVQVDELESRFGLISCGLYPESPKTAFLLPITLSGAEHPHAIFIVGVSPRLPLNEAYHSFLDLLAATVNAAVANAHAYEEERKRAEALAEIDRAKTKFFSNVSHEFRTPLTLMLGPLEEMLRHGDQLSPANREYADTAHRNALRLLKLVNSLLDFSRIEAGRTQASYRPTDLATVTAELASNFCSATEKAGLKLIIDCPPLPEPIYIDPDMWEKIVLNLISNAFKHTFDGEIEVCLRWANQYAELNIKDTGVGIAPDQLLQLFERFYRVPNTRSRSHEGTGIGLSLVKELVNLHGGAIHVESKVDMGTVFKISIPSGKEHLPPSQVEAESSLLSTSVGAKSFIEEALHWLPRDTHPHSDVEHGSGETQTMSPNGTEISCQRIVLADDNTDMLGYIQRLLMPYYEVTAVSDGRAALEAIHQKIPDLVLTDVMMPHLDGFGLLQCLRDDPRTRTLPVIMLSARAGEEASIEGLDAGVNDYLVKPFSAQELLAKVRSNLEMVRIRNEAEETIRELQKMQVIGQLAGGVAHDFNSLLTVITGTLQYLDKTTTGEINRRMLQSALNAASRGEKLTRQLLAFGRKQILSPQAVNINDRLQSILDRVQEIFWGKNVSCKLDTAPDLWPALADPNQVELIILNLARNANDAMPQGGILTLTTRNINLYTATNDLESGKYVLLSIADTGVGMTVETLSRAVEPFFTTKDIGEGTGLGLSQVYGIAKQQGGTASIHSKPGEGTIVEVFFPRYLTENQT